MHALRGKLDNPRGAVIFLNDARVLSFWSQGEKQSRFGRHEGICAKASFESKRPTYTILTRRYGLRLDQTARR